MAKKIVIIAPNRDVDAWVEALKQQDEKLQVEVYPQDTQREKTEFILTWNPPREVFQNYPNLKVVASMGAGVKHIFNNSTIAENVVVTKVEDKQLEKDLGIFVLTSCLNHLRDISFYYTKQQESEWKPIKYVRPEETCVGILGFGTIGQAVGETLYKSDFKVIGYANSNKNHKNIKTFVGKDAFTEFLQQCDILVCLLPLTKETQGILSASLFKQLKKGAYLINVGRGAHLKENDLLEAINNQQLSGAALDVFQEEPLPQEHIFWSHPKITITPHIASVTHPKRVSKQIVENYDRMQSEEKILYQIDKQKGY
ncbi:2-hydroxyacid dehydrogenase [Haloflavibacter putidus]|uniref:Glyoxylate/hydroxypyruvate reductase A n=1 Tax=Haloflavibacter putidus TaxID=2576776 RepID=A0A507ZS38_9FLAO|nr:glyoxylate/hydroxypyruvate reductase A [Haloflavibacter putidus]TQD39817.1 glyoxylate/hydroxypyruvate reductase A [Haloflavibacter putidus]